MLYNQISYDDKAIIVSLSFQPKAANLVNEQLSEIQNIKFGLRLIRLNKAVFYDLETMETSDEFNITLNHPDKSVLLKSLVNENVYLGVSFGNKKPNSASLNSIIVDASLIKI